ncbi:hypothetical protein GOV08_00855 [Candidatus Woesearchaeota archaeon]|nr:hypothetical protein [Candidatus Woesearchaeota archaeon]
MKLCHQIKASVFSKPEDDEQKVKEKLISLFPFDLEKEKIKIGQKTAKGFEEKKIRIFEIVIDKKRNTKEFIDNLMAKLSDEKKKLLLRQKDSRLDDNLRFFIRLDKQKFLDGKYFITDSGDCYHIKMSIAAFPAKREKALEIVEGMIIGKV